MGLSVHTGAHDHSGRPFASTLVTMQLGVALTALLSLLFLSGGLFYLFTYDYNIGPYFTATWAVHFYAGLASIPFLVAKYGSTGFRFLGYYLRLPRFVAAGPPALLPRITSPLLALDFFVLYFSGLYMLFHYYYTVTNIPPFNLQPSVLHTWSAVAAVPLLAVHLGSHLVETARTLYQRRAELPGAPVEPAQVAMGRRGFLAGVVLGGLGLSYGFVHTGLVNRNFRGLYIGRIPVEERGGPGAFPVETLFGKEQVDGASWRLTLEGSDGQARVLTYNELLALPTVTRRIRLSCVSGWTAVPEWTGPRVRDVLVLAGAGQVRSVYFESASGYGVTWRQGPILKSDALLATHVNGAPLSGNHGYPVRLIVPGYPGRRMVKQLVRIALSAEEKLVEPNLHLQA